MIENGKIISWEKEISLLTNPVVIKQTALTIVGTGLFMSFILSFTLAATGEFDGIVPMLRVVLIVTFALGLAIVLIMLIFLRNRTHVCFTINAQGIQWETIDKKIRGANLLAIIAGFLGKNTQTTGSGILASSREKDFIPWNEIVDFKINSKRLQIELKNSWRTVMLVVCKPENFQTVTDILAEMIQPIAETDKSQNKILSKPVFKAIIRSMAVTLITIPLFALTELVALNLLLPLILFCFALAMVWLIPLFGYVVISIAVILVIQLISIGINRYSYLYDNDQILFILAFAGLTYLIWFSIGSIRGKYLSPMLEK